MLIPIAVGDNRWMQLFQIEYFIAVSESMSFTGAARRINIVQSAVSAGIRQLEHELGSELFIRQGRTIRLAPAGEALLPRARTILADVQAARDAVDDIRGTVRGIVTLGTLAYTGNVDLLRIMQTVRRDFPAIVIKLRQTVLGTRSSLADVRSGTLDLALVSVPEGATPGLELFSLHTEGIVFVCPDSHRLAGRKRVSLSEIADGSFVDFPEGWGIRATVDTAFAAAGLSRSVHTEVVSVTMALDLVRAGLGVAFMPASALENGHGQGLRAIQTQLVWHIQVARARTRQPTAAEQVLIDELRQTRSRID